MNDAPRPIWTIGHSTHPAERFLGLLRRHGIGAVADVRSSPYSRFNPQFKREALERSLASDGIRYHFLGRELGARSTDPACYEDGRVQYGRLARTPAFKEGLERVLAESARRPLALMCAERDPLQCHRTLLVARALAGRGIAIRHVLADGSVETHGEALERLLDVVGVPRSDLFRSRDELVAEALARQEQRIAYVDPELARRAGRA